LRGGGEFFRHGGEELIANHVGDFGADLVWFQIGRGLAQVGEREVVGFFGGDDGASGGSD